MARIRGCQRGVCPRAVRAVPAGPLVGGRRHARAVRARGAPRLQARPQPAAPATRAGPHPAPEHPAPSTSVCPPSSAPSTSPSPFAATAISPRRIDPLGSTPVGDPSLHAETHGVTEAELRQLPASLVGGPLAEGAANAAEAIERLRTRLLLEHRLRPRAHLRARRARVAAPSRRGRARSARPTTPVEDVDLLERITEVETFEKFLHKAVPRQDALLDRGPGRDGPDPRRAHRRLGRRRRAPRADRHGASRPPERAGARHAEELRADPRGVQGSAGRPAVPRGPGLDRRREVPRRRPGARARGRLGARGRDLDAAQPEPPGVREPGGRRHGARRLHRHVGARLAGRGQGHHAAGADSRRRRLPRPGHRRRDAEPVAAAPATTSAARSTSSPTTRSASRRRRGRATPRRTPAAWRAASRSRSSTSTPTTRKRASRWRG